MTVGYLKFLQIALHIYTCANIKIQEQVYEKNIPKSDNISLILFSGGWAFPSIMHYLVENATYACFLLFKYTYLLLITFTF